MDFILEDIKKLFRNGNYVGQTVLINAAVFLVLNLALAFSPASWDYTILRWLGLSADIPESLMRIWGYITYMFVHQRFFHLLFNVLWLYWIGRILADIYGQKRYLEVYLLGGLSGGILFVLAAQILPGISTDNFLIGASGSVLAILIATAVLLPDYTMNLLFFGPVRLKYIALVGFILSTLLDLNQNTGGKVAHMGGALYGAVYALQLRNGRDINAGVVGAWNRFAKLFKRKPKLKVVHRNSTGSSKSMKDIDRQAKIDAILDKISSSGYDSLSSAEKDFLFKFSNKD
ncbi:MAG TPA: rhomboid family intramembrane serine protease [Flavobacteriales bacterium]|nr:rhomboid family intramembrane serine protease [Flavobacteriales bacterium]